MLAGWIAVCAGGSALAQTDSNAAATEVKPPRANFGRIPLGSAEPHAPRPGRRPEASPELKEERQTLSEAFADALSVGSAGVGFSMPDLDRLELEGAEADAFEYFWEDESVEMTGNVRFRLQDIHFSADTLVLKEDWAEIHALGNVVVQQGESTVWADEIIYTPAPLTELEQPLIDASPSGEDRERLRLGTVEGKRMHLADPTRELQAEEFAHDGTTRAGAFRAVKGHTGGYYFTAGEILFSGPGTGKGHDVTISTCDHDPPHYCIHFTDVEVERGEIVRGSNAQLQFGRLKTPLYWPRWSYRMGAPGAISVDFDSGRRAAIGYYVNVAQRFGVAPGVDLGVRLFPTTKEGVGLGLEGNYDFMDKPASRLFRSAGTWHTMYTTEDRGFTEWYHRYEPHEDTVALMQVEHWYDRDFVKDFYYDRYRTGRSLEPSRTSPIPGPATLLPGLSGSAPTTSSPKPSTRPR